MPTVASEKNRKLLEGIFVYRPRVLQTVTSLNVVSIVIQRARPPENRKFKSPAGIRFSLWKKNSSPRERRKWSLGLGHNLKAFGLACVRTSK